MSSILQLFLTVYLLNCMLQKTYLSMILSQDNTNTQRLYPQDYGDRKFVNTLSLIPRRTKTHTGNIFSSALFLSFPKNDSIHFISLSYPWSSGQLLVASKKFSRICGEWKYQTFGSYSTNQVSVKLWLGYFDYVCLKIFICFFFLKK